MIGPSDLRDLQKQFQEEPNLGEEKEEEFLVEHLDYQYIRNCTDVKELQLLQNVLESGKEGFYPQLLEFLKNRIHTLQPVEKEIVDFVNLANELKEMENSLSDVIQSKNVKQENAKKKMENKSLSQRIKSDDYRAWDTLDIDQELEKIDSCDIMIKDGKLSELPKIESKVNVDISKIKLKSKGEIEVLAEQEKVKGNECFKAGEYNDAIVFYTRSLQILKRAHVFTNRANAFLKIGQYERAEMDSSAALELNDTLYIFKAYVRRAEARRKRGKLWDALQDIDAALKVDPNSTLASNLRIQIEKEYKKVEGDLAKDTRGPKSRIKIEEDNSVTELQPSSISEITDEDAQLFISPKTNNDENISIQKVDDFIQGLKTLSPNLGTKSGEQVKKNEELAETLVVQDIDAVDDDCDAFKREIESSVSKITVIDKEKIDDDCALFKKELGVRKIESSKLDKEAISGVLDENINRDDAEIKLQIEEMAGCKDDRQISLDGMSEIDEDLEPKDSLKSSPGGASNDSVSIPKLLSFVAPKSSIEFEATWNSMKGNLVQFASYLSCISEREIMKYLAMVNNADLHIDLILSTEHMKDAEVILKILKFITTLPRFNVVKRFMTRKQKAQLATNLIKLKSEINDERIDMLSDNYNL